MANPGPVFETAAPGDYLSGDEIVEVTHPAVHELARTLRQRGGDDVGFAKVAFEWVRDQVGHSYDVADPRVTLTAGEVLEHRVGLCYAKSHLLAALLRAEGVPTGLCYQRLTHGDGHVLHGLVAIYLDGAWHRQDPRGNNSVVDAQFSLDGEKLAWRADPGQGEIDYPQVFAAPARCVVETLRGATDLLAIYGVGLPTGLDTRDLA